MSKINIFRRGRGLSLSSVLNVLGLAVAFAAFYIILCQVNYEFGFNKKIKNVDKVFVISSGEHAGGGKRNLSFCRPLAELIIDSSPNIEYGGIINLGYNGSGKQSFWVDRNNEKHIVEMSATPISGDALKAIGLEPIAGSFDKMVNRTSFAISQSVAKKFDLEVGMQLNQGDTPGTIVAIYEDMAENSHLKHCELLYNLDKENLESYSEWGYTYFVKLIDPSQKEDMEENLTSTIRPFFKDKLLDQIAEAGEEIDASDAEINKAINTFLDMADVQLIPLGGLYFQEGISSMIDFGNRTTTTVLLIVAILVIGIAFVNYINFFFALIPERIRGVNTKKVLGCSRRELIMSVVTESLTLITVALILAFAFVMLFNMSELVHLVAAKTALSANISLAISTVIIALVVAVVSSLYPAFYITSFEPALVLKGSFGATKQGKTLRYGLVGLQFVISIGLIIVSSFINLQRNYMVNYDMGFDKEQLLYVHTTYDIGKNAEAVEERLKSDPQIQDVTWASGELIAPIRMGWGRSFKGEAITFQCYPVAWDFPEFMGIEILEGRSFRKEDEIGENGVFIFNEACKLKFGLTLDDKINGHLSEATEIVGFCNSFSFMSLKEEVGPFALYVYGKSPWTYPSTAFIRVAANANYQYVMKHIGTVLSEWAPKIAPDQWTINFFDENIEKTYQKEKSLSQLISLFTLIAIVISLMGVFGLVMFETQYRRREIALRRVSGASIKDILIMFCSRFVKIVLICFVVAAPISYYIVSQYLKTFAHRIPIYWWVFALALIAVMFVTLCVVVIQTWKAATADPVDSIKTE